MARYGENFKFYLEEQVLTFPCYSRGILAKSCYPLGLCFVFYKWKKESHHLSDVKVNYSCLFTTDITRWMKKEI